MAKKIHHIYSSGQSETKNSQITNDECPYMRSSGLTAMLIKMFIDQAPDGEMSFSSAEQFGAYIMLNTVQEDIERMQNDYLDLQKELREKDNGLSGKNEINNLTEN